jgi:ABC-type amino acid transport substrate-binding protein
MRAHRQLAIETGSMESSVAGAAARVARWTRRCIVTLVTASVAFGAAAQPNVASAGISALNLTAAERSWLVEHPRVRVFTKTEWAPIDLYTYEGQFRGLSGDYLALIAQRLGTTLEFKSAPTLAAALEALKRGDADILPSVARTAERETFMDFSQPYLDVPNVYVARRGVTGVGSDQAMSGLRVAVERGYAVISLIRERHPQARIVEFTDSAAALRGVSEGNADVYRSGEFDHAFVTGIRDGLRARGAAQLTRLGQHSSQEPAPERAGRVHERSEGREFRCVRPKPSIDFGRGESPRRKIPSRASHCGGAAAATSLARMVRAPSSSKTGPGGIQHNARRRADRRTNSGVQGSVATKVAPDGSPACPAENVDLGRSRYS